MNDKFEYEEKQNRTINSIKKIKNDFKLKEGVKIMGKNKIINNIEKGKGNRRYRLMPVFVSVLLICMLLMATTVMAFPRAAVKYAKGLPIVKELAEKDESLDILNNQVEDMQKEAKIKNEKIESLEKEVEQLKIRIKEISDEEIKEVETTVNNNEDLNIRLQTLVIDFVKEMYKGNLDKAAGYCTGQFAKTVKETPDDIIMRKENTVVFTQITNVSKNNDGTYYVFLRLNDSTGEEADYQINFEIIELNKEYKISFAGLDA